MDIPDNFALRMKYLGYSGTVVWLYLRHCWWKDRRSEPDVFPSIDKISEDTGLGHSQVTRAIKSLEALCYLQVLRKAKQPNHYYILEGDADDREFLLRVNRHWKELDVKPFQETDD